MSKEAVTDIVVAFMEDLEDAGYYAMIYSYAKFFDDNLIYDRIADYDIWVACWGDEDKLFENFSYHYGMWQYSETGRLKGIDEYVDLNYCYKDYKSTIKKYGLNKSAIK
jgi:GH25 family lysozyme M1 (1,4-beta-N-acetylmuramidase)